METKTKGVDTIKVNKYMLEWIAWYYANGKYPWNDDGKSITDFNEEELLLIISKKNKIKSLVYNNGI